METIYAPRSPENSVPESKAFKNPKKKSPRGPLPRTSAGSFSPASSPQLHVLPASTSPLYLPYCNNNNIGYSQPPLLPLPRVNSSLPLPRATSSISLPCVKNRPPARFSGKATEKSQSQTQKRPSVKPANRGQTLTRTGSVPVGSYPVDVYPGPALMLLSPPPSSLPMPRFSIKPKLSCTAEAVAGDEDGAADNLRRLLRLR